MMSDPTNAKTVAALTPYRKYVITACVSPAPCACEVSGSNDPTKPIVVIITSQVAVPPKLAAANAASPT